jgi:hypothetical protein
MEYDKIAKEKIGVVEFTLFPEMTPVQQECHTPSSYGQ